jgi:CheY-like chemotaxis protein
MGGDLWLESEPGHGSIFAFELELPESPQSDGIIEVEPLGNLAGVRVLVVDDNGTNRRILDELLKSWSMLPTLAESGPAALELLRQAALQGRPFQLLLVDYHMPQMDGFMFVDAVRSDSANEGATIMMLTSSDRLDAIERCRSLGISATLLKPLRLSELRLALVQTLGSAGQHAASAGAQVQIPQAGKYQLKILLAEDNLVNQQVAKRLLMKMGHKLRIVENGQAALDALRYEPFDVVLMDVQMPVMDGLAAAAAIRRTEERTDRHQHIVAMTAHAMAGDRERCLEAGMDDYISKPITPSALSELLSRVPVPPGTL